MMKMKLFGAVLVGVMVTGAAVVGAQAMGGAAKKAASLGSVRIAKNVMADGKALAGRFELMLRT